ncbi:MAG: hypothetical protein ACHQNE_09400, partial [Candidatus Kapaibacterium sp.]
MSRVKNKVATVTGALLGIDQQAALRLSALPYSAGVRPSILLSIAIRATTLFTILIWPVLVSAQSTERKSVGFRDPIILGLSFGTM